MIRHFIKIAFRNINKQKFFTIINLLSLSCGLTFSFLFLLYYRNECSYDQYEANSSHIYRIYEWTKEQEGSEYKGNASLYFPLGPAVASELPGIQNFLRVKNDLNVSYLRHGDNMLKTKVTYADSSFFTFFPFPLVQGTIKEAMNMPNNIILSQKTARMLFGKENCIGQIVNLLSSGDTATFIVSGVTGELPNSSIAFDLLIGMSHFQQTQPGKALTNRWDITDFENYILLDKKAEPASYVRQLVGFRKKYFPGESDGQGQPPASFQLQPLADVHRNSLISSQITAVTFDKTSIWLFFIIAMGVLLIGCVNFTTLAIGRSSHRSKEIGLRKVLGAEKQQIMWQFLGESVLLSLLSGLTALLFCWLLLPTFNSLMLTQLTYSQFFHPEGIWILSAIIFLSSLLSGFYPAAILSRLNIIQVFKSNIRFNGSNIFTKSMMTMQFVLSIGLIISTVVMIRQLNYIRNMDVGFNKDNVVVIDASAVISSNVYSSFRQSLIDNDKVLGITSSQGLFGQNYNVSGFDFQGKNYNAMSFACDFDFLPIMGMHLIAGRNISKTRREDTINSVIVNEAFATELGLSDSALLGMKLSGFSYRQENDPVIVGVARNFNLLSAHEQIKPLMFRNKHNYMPTVFYVHLKPGNITQSMTQIREAWNKSTGGALFDYTFFDQYLYSQYTKEQRLEKIIGWSGLIGILLAVFGLAGIAYLSSENRMKELTIRMVFGSSWISNFLLVANNFVKLIILAFVIAAPLSYILLNQWLKSFAYRVHIGAWVFIGSIAGCLILSYMVVLESTLKLLFIKPVVSLK